MSPPTSSTGSVATPDGLELYYESRGESRGAGPAALVVPSASWLARDMDPLAPGRRVVFYDIRGRGRSSAIHEEGLLGLEKDVDDLELLRAHLGLERVTLLGWSYHGAITARYALAHPHRVERMILVGPTAPAEEPYWTEFLHRFGQRVDLARLRRLDEERRSGLKSSDPRAWCEAVHEVFFLAYVADPRSLERMKSSPCVEPNLDADRVNDQGRRILEKLAGYDWRDEFRALTVPTLLIHGVEDPVALSGTEEWDRILPSSRLLVWEGVGHIPWVEVPERFFGVVNDFLDGAWPAAS